MLSGRYVGRYVYLLTTKGEVSGTISDASAAGIQLSNASCDQGLFSKMSVSSSDILALKLRQVTDKDRSPATAVEKSKTSRSEGGSSADSVTSSSSNDELPRQPTSKISGAEPPPLAADHTANAQVVLDTPKASKSPVLVKPSPTTVDQASVNQERPSDPRSSSNLAGKLGTPAKHNDNNLKAKAHLSAATKPTDKQDAVKPVKKQATNESVAGPPFPSVPNQPVSPSAQGQKGAATGVSTTVQQPPGRQVAASGNKDQHWLVRGPHILSQNGAIPCCSALQLLCIRQALTHCGISEDALMELAGRGIVESCIQLFAEKHIEFAGSTVLVMIGSSTSRIEALTACRILVSLGVHVIAVSWGPLDAGLQAAARGFEHSGGIMASTRKDFAAALQNNQVTAIIDALQGFEGTPIADQVQSSAQFKLANWLVKYTQAQTCLKLSLDIPVSIGERSLEVDAVVSIGFPLEALKRHSPSWLYVVNFAVPAGFYETLNMGRLACATFDHKLLISVDLRNGCPERKEI